MGPERALDALRKALAMGADRAVLVSDEAAAGSDLVATSRVLAARSSARSADLVLFGQQAERLRRRRPVGRGRRPPAPPADLAGRRADGRGRHGPRQAADRVRLRRDRGAAARGRRRLGRDQRAALPVAQGDHGREEEAAGDADARRPRCRGRRAARAARGPRCSRSAIRRRAARRARSRTTATRAAADRRVPRGEEGCFEHARLPGAPRRRAAEGLARRPRQGCAARRRRRGA